MTTQRSAILAILLLVPVPSIGVCAAIVLFPDEPVGQTVFLLAKVWLLAFPAVWHKIVDRQKLSWSPPRKGGFGFGVVSGVLISLLIAGAYIVFGDHLIDRQVFQAKIEEIGLANPALYMGGAAYWILVNSVLEEYVWRWFVVKKCEALFPAKVAIGLSAMFFTLHHIIAMWGYMGAWMALLCAVGVFIGGVVWSYIYVRFRSIWPAYVSHAIVDLCIFLIGAEMLFSSWIG